MRRPPRHRRSNRGFALVALLALFAAGALYYVVSTLSPQIIDTYRTRKTQEALAEARDALLGYALQYRDQQLAQTPPVLDTMYGYLPLPDLGSFRNLNVGCTGEGCDASNFSGNGNNVTVIGRFPWRLIGTEPIRDGYGECLWLAVSGSHQRVMKTSPMNWDALGQLDVVVANGANNLASIVNTAHDRPVAIVFSAGPPLPGQNRSTSANDDVTQCGGNYDVANYLDPGTGAAGALAGVANYFGVSTNHASEDTSATPKQLSSQGTIQRRTDSTLWQAGCPTGGDCATVANDRGLILTSDILFGALRKNSNFRVDINSLLDRIVSCLRDLGTPGGYIKIPGADDDACYGADTVPRGYYPNYKEMMFVAGGTMQVNGEACSGALLFANQRSGQSRATAADKSAFTNYLEGINQTSFNTSGTLFSGQEQLDRVSSTQTISQDIVRCIPSTPNFVTVQSPTLTAAGIPQFTDYSPSTGILTLGQTIDTPIAAPLANFLYGCAWRPEARAMDSGLRSYFTLRISDGGVSSAPHEGFTFSIVDGDNNDVDACGAAAQHLGYSGNNTESPFIVPPKIGIEFDLRRLAGESGFDPSLPDHLSNGRNDPLTSGSGYRGGHVAVTYWGGESAISTAHGPTPTCTPPSFELGGLCYLPQEEDDNVHGQPATARVGFAPPPNNPAAPIPPLSVPPDAPAGMYKLDPDRTSVPVNQDFHVRVELSRATTTDFRLPQARVATTALIDLANPFTLIDGVFHFAIDGVYLFDGDRILVKNQFDASQNGVYVWHAGAPPTMERATDADSSVELAGLTVEVKQGANNARSIWRQNNTNAVIGTDTLNWTNIRVKVAAPTATSIANPGSMLDGIRMKSGDRVYVRSTGVYVWNGPAAPMTPAPDITPGAAIQVQQGSDATSWWRFDGATWQRLAVRTTTQAPLALNTPGASIGGVTLANGDRVLIKNQNSAAENGIYIWNGPAVSMTRAADADTAIELAGAITQVVDGNDAGRTFRQTTLPASATVGAQAMQWEAVDRSPNYLFEVWILPESLSYANMINAMKDTTRPISALYPSFTPQLRNSPIIAYPFRNVRLGFTTGQRTTVIDQTIMIRNSFTTWLQ